VISTEAEKAYARKWYQEHKTEIAEKRRRESEKIKAAKVAYAQSEKGIETRKQWEALNAERQRLKWKRHSDNRRLEILKHYGGDPPACACCGERALKFLAVDHRDGWGNRHRKALLEAGEIKSIGTSFFQWLKRNGYPEGFRVLCHNCNMANGSYGECPHKDERLTLETLHQTAIRLLGAL
jgi:hypothetical protein